MAASALVNLVVFTIAMFSLPFGAYYGVYAITLGEAGDQRQKVNRNNAPKNETGYRTESPRDTTTVCRLLLYRRMSLNYLKPEKEETSKGKGVALQKPTRWSITVLVDNEEDENEQDAMWRKSVVDVKYGSKG